MKNYPVKSGKLYIGAGLDMLNKDIGRIYWDKPNYQAIVFGGSGSGKSELISRWTYESIIDDNQVFLIDPKGSKSWLEAFLLACYRKGVLYDKEKGPIILTLPYPELSVKINPLYGMNPHQIASTISSGIPEGKEPFFKQIAYEIVLASTLGLKAIGIEEIILSDIYSYLNVASLQDLYQKVVNTAPSNIKNPELIKEAMQSLNTIAQFDPQYFPRVNSSLRTYLTRIITGDAGAILNVRAGNIIWDRLNKGNLKFFAFLNAEAMQQIAYDVGRLLFANLLVYVGMQSQRLKVIQPQLRVIVDEATEIGFAEINKAIRLVRERNVSVSLFTQSPSGFASAFGQQGKNIVIDIVNSCDLRIGLRLASDEDREFMASMSPEVPKPQLVMHPNQINLVYKQGRLIENFDFEKLELGFGYAFTDKTVYYFYSPLIKKYDNMKVKVVFLDEEEAKKEKADLLVNLKDLSIEQDLKEEEDVLLIFISELKKNYDSFIKLEFSDISVRDFYNEASKYISIYKDDLIKILHLFDLFKGTISSIAKNDRHLLSRITLLQHSINTALKSIKKIQEEPEKFKDDEDKEIFILSALTHDIGKAFIKNPNTYTKEEHENIARQILNNLNINEKIIQIATSHHSYDELLSETGINPSSYKLSQELRKIDAESRKEETQFALSTLALNYEKEINKFFKMLESTLNRKKDYIYANTFNYSIAELPTAMVNKLIAVDWFKKNIKSLELDENTILHLLPNARYVNVDAPPLFNNVPYIAFTLPQEPNILPASGELKKIDTLIVKEI